MLSEERYKRYPASLVTSLFHIKSPYHLGYHINVW